MKSLRPAIEHGREVLSSSDRVRVLTLGEKGLAGKDCCLIQSIAVRSYVRCASGDWQLVNGYVVLMEYDRYPHVVLYGRVSGLRPQGQQGNWLNNIADDCVAGC